VLFWTGQGVLTPKYYVPFFVIFSLAKMHESIGSRKKGQNHGTPDVHIQLFILI
jgi:hypothetical protein